MSNNSTPLKAVYLSSQDVKTASSILYQAYYDDPFFRQCFDVKTDGYEQRLRAAIREEMSVFWQTSQPMIGVYDDNEVLLGITCVCQPNTDLAPGRFWHWRLKMLLTAGYVSTQNMIEKEKQVKFALPSHNCHLIAFIAVKPQLQKQGVGRFILNAVINLVNEHVTSEGVGVLVTVDKYQSLFTDFGFSFIETLNVGKIKTELMYYKKV